MLNGNCLFYLVSLCCFTTLATAQPVSGLTNRRDTSFTTWGAYQKLKKTFPEARIVEPVTPDGVTASMNLVYCSQNGRDLHLDAFYPTKFQRRALRPAVLVIHGGGWRSGDRSQHIPLAQRLAAAGYVAVTVEYRLSTEALYPAAVHDLKSAVRWLRANAKTYAIDTARIAAVGFSAGGQLAALMGATGNPAARGKAAPALEGEGCHQEASTAIQAVVDLDGLLAFDHPESGEGDDSKSTSAATYWFGGPKTEKLAQWHEASALTYVHLQTAPILFINSSVDRMHAGRDDLRKQLSKRGIYSEEHTFPEAPHIFCLLHPWFEPTLNYTITFLDKVFRVKR
ncbi:alpha/beta hydrolase fold domain-containing protein [Fibrella aquatica]|uniref:alpha/beta hydrolase fold domain-containing protein n=1 Tax=Fibrella aquatica TaxID=3242487 RepID=UPI0035207868